MKSTIITDPFLYVLFTSRIFSQDKQRKTNTKLEADVWVLKQIYKGCVLEQVGQGRPQKTDTGQTADVLKRDQVKGT